MTGWIRHDARQGQHSEENPRSPGCPIAQQATIPSSAIRVFIEWGPGSQKDGGMLPYRVDAAI